MIFFSFAHQVILHYPSGKKSMIVKEGTHQQICKAIMRGGNTDCVVADILCKSKPNEIIRCSQKIVQEESRNISKRGSGTVLQKKNYENVFNFQWEEFHQNLQEKCPGLLSILTSAVSDIPPTVASKPFFHVLQSAGIVLHGRSQEMSLLQFMNGFLLTHGGCTQRVYFWNLFCIE